MFKKLIALFAVAALSGTIGANVDAAEITVKKGDTLWNIAKVHKTTIRNIKKRNHLTSDLIRPGEKLTIDSHKKVSKHGKKKKSVSKKKYVKKNRALKKSRVLKVKATAYTAKCKGCSGITATGINLKANPKAKVISVDPKIIPLGSKVYVEGYGYAVAGDTGGAIKGHRIDVFVPSKTKAVNWGRKQVNVTIMN
ncbi:3D domain-containing protein [Bacillus xiapuensis]|uniref:3D domain-containing protein n=1 Tax=Bacillus xiapuensis TaxID=2014075 RepID=A0ABU6NE93_9BACI|nr:3D domain-containing protein [Bacillus xiapuensis]